MDKDSISSADIRRPSLKRKRSATSSSSSFCFACCFRKRTTSNSNGGVENHPHRDRHHHDHQPQPRLLRASSTWLKALMSDFPEFRDRYKSIVSRLGRTQRRHASDFSYDAFNYALNFEDESRVDDEFPPRSFSARLPPTPHTPTEKAEVDTVDAAVDAAGVVS